MTITFSSKSELMDFTNRFDGTGYFVRENIISTSRLVCFAEFSGLITLTEFSAFPMTFEFEKDMVQLCGVIVERDGKKDVVFTSYMEMKETAKRLGGKAVCKTFSLDERYDGHKRYREILNPELSDKVLDYLKKDILLGNKY